METTNSMNNNLNILNKEKIDMSTSSNKSSPLLVSEWMQKNIDNGFDEKKTFEPDTDQNWIKYVNLPNNMRIGLGHFMKGFDSWHSSHIGYMISGKMRVTLQNNPDPNTSNNSNMNNDDNNKLYTAGDVFYIPALTHTSVVEDGPVIVLYFVNFYEDPKLNKLFKKSFDNPDNTRQLSKSTIKSINITNDIEVNLGTFNSNWKWSTDIKPVAGTDLCMFSHVTIALGGKMKLELHNKNDNTVTSRTITEGDISIIPPNHDAYIEGNQPCNLLVLDSVFKTYGVPQKK
jgi:quercetin dioxygenase-like cupin family protein